MPIKLAAAPRCRDRAQRRADARVENQELQADHQRDRHGEDDDLHVRHAMPLPERARRVSSSWGKNFGSGPKSI